MQERFLIPVYNKEALLSFLSRNFQNVTYSFRLHDKALF